MAEEEGKKLNPPSKGNKSLSFVSLHDFEPRHEKTGILHMRKQRRRSASR